MNYFVIINFILLSAVAVFADDCDRCEPMAEVSVSNKGLARMIEVSMKENLKLFNETVKKRSGFRDLKLDRSQCKKQTIKQAYNAKDTCYGLPQLDDGLGIGGDTVLRPFSAEISGLNLNQLELGMDQPVTCTNLKCQFEIGLKKLDVSGQFRMDYSDNQESFIPPSQLRLSTGQNVNLKLSGEINVDPKTGKLNDLVFLNEKKSQLTYGPGSLHFDMSLNKPFASEADKKKKYANAYRRIMSATKINSQLIDQSYEMALFQMTVAARKKIDPDMKKNFSEVAKQADQIVEEQIRSQYGSKAAFKKSISDIAWPNPQDDDAILKFMADPPKEIYHLTSVTDRLDRVGLYAMAENAGYTNDHAYMFAFMSESLINKMGSDPFLTKQMVEPMLSHELLPLIHDQVNTELRQLKGYWDHLAKVPNLDVPTIQKMSKLQYQLSRSTDESEKDRLRREIIELTKNWENAWLPIDTEVLIDQNTRQQKLIKALVTNKDPACKDYPQKFSDDQDDDFDVRTEVGPKALQEYFKKLGEKKNIEVCIESPDPVNCTGGTKVKLKSSPKITCENGDIKMDLDTEAAKSIFKVDVQTSVKARLKNCNGDPCFELMDEKGQFKNVFLSTLFGGLLQRSLSSAVKQSTNAPINIPFVKLDQVKTNPKNCNSKLDWQIRPVP